MDEHTKACQLVKSMPNDKLIKCWEAICEGALFYCKKTNGIPTSEWMDLVHNELTISRELLKK